MVKWLTIDAARGKWKSNYEYDEGINEVTSKSCTPKLLYAYNSVLEVIVISSI